MKIKSPTYKPNSSNDGFQRLMCNDTVKTTPDQDRATARPWKVRTGINEAFIDAKNIVCLAVVNSLDNDGEYSAAKSREAKANAAMIVRAVNQHEALKADNARLRDLCRRCYKVFHSSIGDGDWLNSKLAGEIRAALKEVQEGGV